MKPLKGLNTDTSETDQIPGTYRYAKNIIDSNTLGAKENEDGFDAIPSIIFPYTVHGVIPIEKDFIVFGTNGVACEIGLVTKTGETTYSYSAIYNNPDLNLDNSKPVKGEWRRDVNGNRIITWIDDINPPRILNIDDTSSVNDVNDLLLFQSIINPSIQTGVVQDTGGSLKTGAIIPITRYKNFDGSETSWFVHDKVFYIVDEPKSGTFERMDGSVGGVITSKSLHLTLEQIDTRFDTVVLGYIQIIDGIITAYETTEVDAQSTITVTISGSETTTDVSLDEVLTNQANYINAKAITQLSGRLYLGNLTSTAIPELQEVANSIRINYIPSLVTVVSNTSNHKDNLPPTFLPGEVYAFYLGVELLRGGWAYYHIPGREAVDDELFTVSSVGVPSGLKYQVRDTSNYSPLGATTNMGYWENENEQYPTGSSFPTGNVRHHRMPTLSRLINFHYSIFTPNPDIGITVLPRLTIEASNVIIPAEIQSQITRWKIFYAKKTDESSLYIGDDLIQFSGNPAADYGGVKTRWGTGGNWWLLPDGPSPWADSSITNLLRNNLRGHCNAYDINSATPNPDYLEFCYKLRKSSLNVQYGGFRSVGGKITVAGENISSVAGTVVDFTVPTVTTRTDLTPNTQRSISNFVKVPQNTIIDNASTKYTEKILDISLILTTTDFDGITLGSIHPRSGGTPAEQDQLQNFTGGFVPGFDGFEETNYFQYFRILSNVHSAFGRQELIPLEGYSSPSETSGVFEGGNGFLCYQSYLACGPLNTSPEATLTDPFEEGIRSWKAYIGYSRYNVNFRHAIVGDISTYYHGKNDVRSMFYPYAASSSVQTRPLFTLSNTEVNNIQYNTDYNYLNELIVGVIWSNNLIQETTFPNTIIFSTLQSEDSKEFSWRTFLAGDKYTTAKNKGYIVNLQGIANQQLIIHTQYSILRTRTDAKPEVDGENIFFKSANIFDLPPEDLVPTAQAYGGTQNKLACILTKAGYVYVDDIQGRVFLYSGNALEEISTLGLRKFFRDFMKLNSDNNDNTFTQNGYTIGYDAKNNRLLLTKKFGAFSWTVSYNFIAKHWTSYHSYIPDYYFNTVDDLLYVLKDNALYVTNRTKTTSTKGVYFTPTIYPAIIDLVFNEAPYDDKEFTGITWVSEMYPNTISNGTYDPTLSYNDTCTHLTIYTPQHCTGRVVLSRNSDIDSLYATNIRNLNRTWYFHDVRDIAIATGFVTSFFGNYGIDPTKLNSSMEWYDRRRFIDKYVICRFEYDNVINNRFLFLEGGVIYKNAVR